MIVVVCVVCHSLLKKAKSSADPDEEMPREVNEMLSDLNEKIESVDKKY